MSRTGRSLPAESSEEPKISIGADGGEIDNPRSDHGHIDPRGHVGFFNQNGELLLEEFMRVRLGDTTSGTGQITKRPAVISTAHSRSTRASSSRLSAETTR